MNGDLRTIARGIRHHLMTGLIGRTTGSDPKQNHFVFAEVPDWQLRQWLDIAEGLASAAEAREQQAGEADLNGGESPDVGTHRAPD